MRQQTVTLKIVYDETLLGEPDCWAWEAIFYGRSKLRRRPSLNARPDLFALNQGASDGVIVEFVSASEIETLVVEPETDENKYVSGPLGDPNQETVVQAIERGIRYRRRELEAHCRRLELDAIFRSKPAPQSPGDNH